MAELTERQIKELDIDWYCLVKGIPTHIASMGGMVPKLFRDRNKLRILQDGVANIEPFAKAKLNLAVIRELVTEGYDYLDDQMIREAIEMAYRNHPGFQYLRNYDLPVRLFASTFVEKARRGFRSYARRDSAKGNEFVLIAEPESPVEYKAGGIRLEALECEVKENGNRIALML